MTRKSPTITAGIHALEEQLAVSADLRRFAQSGRGFADERDRVTTLAVLDREAGEIRNALRILRTVCVHRGQLLP